jgi:inosose dehydratase
MTNYERRLGISPLTWTNDDMPSLGGKTPFEQSIREMRLAKFCGTELGTKFPKDARTLRPKLQSQNLQLVASWFSTFLTDEAQEEPTYQRFESFLRLLSQMGARVANLCECTKAIHQTSAPMFGAKPQMSERAWPRLIKGLERLGKQARRYDIVIAYHHHMGTLIQNEAEIHRLMEMSDPADVHLLLDTGHARLAGIDTLEVLRRHASRIKHVHLKDVREQVAMQARERSLSFLDAVKAGVFTVPGDGDIAFEPIIARLRKQNYKAWFMVEAEQDPGLAHPLTYAHLARNNIEKIFRKSL